MLFVALLKATASTPKEKSLLLCEGKEKQELPPLNTTFGV